MAETNKIDKTILYLTDSVLHEPLAQACRDVLLRNANGMPIVSVSQKPLDFETNVCMGPMPRTGMSIDVSLNAGLEKIQTEWVMIAEHDCLYSVEHIKYIPESSQDDFHYNDNVWLAQWHNPIHTEWNGMYSYMSRRRVQSQLVCRTDRLREAMEMKLAITAHPDWAKRYPSGRIAEPGCCTRKRTIVLARRSEVKHLMPIVLKYLDAYIAVDFKTKDPNVDIRHGGNFTGQRRGRARRFKLEPWGNLYDALGGVKWNG